MTTVIMLQHNDMDLTRGALRSFLNYHKKNFEILLVDNASALDPGPLRSEFPVVTLLENKRNVGFATANNQAARQARGEFLFFLNNDTIFESEVLPRVESFFETHPATGIVGPKLLNVDRSFQISAGSLPTFWSEIGDKILYGLVRRRMPLAIEHAEKKYAKEQPVGWVTGAALFIRRSLFMRLGGFDQGMFMYFEDKDLCRRAGETGSSVYYFPGVSLVHLKGGSSPDGNRASLRQIYRESQVRYYAIHRPRYERALLSVYLNLRREP